MKAIRDIRTHYILYLSTSKRPINVERRHSTLDIYPRLSLKNIIKNYALDCVTLLRKSHGFADHGVVPEATPVGASMGA